LIPERRSLLPTTVAMVPAITAIAARDADCFAGVEFAVRAAMTSAVMRRVIVDSGPAIAFVDCGRHSAGDHRRSSPGMRTALRVWRSTLLAAPSQDAAKLSDHPVKPSAGGKDDGATPEYCEF
jgi:hypothetical protein